VWVLPFCLVPFAFAVLWGLGYVRSADELGALKVGDGETDLQHAVIAAGREMMSDMGDGDALRW
jgi:hypothetical protein